MLTELLGKPFGTQPLQALLQERLGPLLEAQTDAAPLPSSIAKDIAALHKVVMPLPEHFPWSLEDFARLVGILQMVHGIETKVDAMRHPPTLH